MPVLLRFDGILRSRLEAIYAAFESAKKEFAYRAGYQLCYPIKVNQQRHVVESILEAGQNVPFGLEVGSKPELLAVMALEQKSQELLLCNGYKDRESNILN